MRVCSTRIKKNAHWIRLISICCIAVVFAMFWSHGPAKGASDKPLDAVRYLLLHHKPTPSPTPSPTPTSTPHPTGALASAGLLKNSAAGSSAGLALGAMAGIFFVLRRKDKD